MFNDKHFLNFIKKITIKMLPILFLLGVFSGYMPSYMIYNSKAQKTDFDDLVEQAKKADLVFFGEEHNNPIDHWLELRLLKALYKAHKENLVMGAEMFEADGQLLIDEYFNNQISKKSFEAEERLWKNYKTDYKPLLEFAKEKKLKLVATDIPRRYAATVARKGLKYLDSLDAQSKSYIADLPVEVNKNLKVYKELQEMMSGMGGGHKMTESKKKKEIQPSSQSDTTKAGKEKKAEMNEMKKMMKSHNLSHIVEAQAIKDATMAKFILKNMKPGNKFIHFNGSKHSDYHEGIVWYIKQARPDLKILVISSNEQSSLDSLETENKDLGDFIIITPDDMTKTNR